MSKRSLGNVKSKYFSIDSYFKEGTENNKKIKTSNSNDPFNQQIEEAIKLSMSTKEQCPICQTMIQTEFMSMEVHVNQCLDIKQTNEEEEEEFKEEKCEDKVIEEQEDNGEEQECKRDNDKEEENKDEEDEFSYFMDDDDEEILGEVLSFEQNMEKDKENQTSELSLSSLKEKFSFTSTETSFTPSSWKDTPAVNLNTKSKKKQKPCPFYKRVKGKFHRIERKPRN